MNKPKSIVRLQSHRNQTPTGRPSATAARKLAHYLAFGRGRPQVQAQHPQRGQWYTETGQPLDHEAVLAWVMAQGKAHSHTYQLLLSVNEANLADTAYLEAMTAGRDFFPQWRLITHQDTQHSHAHVLAFGDRDIPIRERPFRSWWQSVRQALEQQQAQHMETRQQEQEVTRHMHREHDLALLQPDLEHEADWGMEV